jgi:peptidoglycan hydrolase FlgJ
LGNSIAPLPSADPVAPLDASEDALGVAHLGASEGTPADPKIWEAAKKFEAMAIGQLLAPMFDTVDTSHSLFGGGEAETTWKPMLVDAIGKQIEGHGGFGLAQPVYAAMPRAQEAGARQAGARPGVASVGVASGGGAPATDTMTALHRVSTAQSVPVVQAALRQGIAQPRKTR